MPLFAQSTIDGFLGSCLGFIVGSLTMALTRGISHSTPEDRADLLFAELYILITGFNSARANGSSFLAGAMVGYMMAMLAAGEVPIINCNYLKSHDLAYSPFCKKS